MSRKLFILVTLLFSILFFTRSVLAEGLVENTVPERIEAKQLDKKAKVLANYLARYNSPLQYHAQDFIDDAIEFGLDW